jgi:hypothetical protein
MVFVYRDMDKEDGHDAECRVERLAFDFKI